MEGIREMLEAARERGLPVGLFRALMHVSIGRKITRSNGNVISTGITWRELSGLLKLARFDRDLVREYGSDPESFAPRDRERFWYAAIAQARVDSPEAYSEAERIIPFLKELGFVVGPPPSSMPSSLPAESSTNARASETQTPPDKSSKRKKSN